MSDTKAKPEKLHLLGDHLVKNPRRKAAAQNGGLVECKISKHHGFHPTGELCPDCDWTVPDYGFLLDY